jgi:hypothetical protein
MFHIGYCYPWEDEYVDNLGTYAGVLWLRSVLVSHLPSYWSTYDWEKDYIENAGGATDDNYVAAYTSSCHLDGYGYSATDVPTGLGDGDVKLLLHGDEVDGSKTFDDESSSNHTCIAEGGAEADTSQKKFGTASIYFDGVDGRVTNADHADWTLGTGAFTIDIWCRFPHFSQDIGFFRIEEDWENYFSFCYSQEDNAWIICLNVAGVRTFLDWKSGYTPDPGVWVHITIIRGWGGDTNDGKILWKADSGPSTSGNLDFTGVTFPNFAAAKGFELGVGRMVEDDEQAGWIAGTDIEADHQVVYGNLHIDEARVTGRARWTANFSAPTAAQDLSGST